MQLIKLFACVRGISVAALFYPRGRWQVFHFRYWKYQSYYTDRHCSESEYQHEIEKKLIILVNFYCKIEKFKIVILFCKTSIVISFIVLICPLTNGAWFMKFIEINCIESNWWKIDNYLNLNSALKKKFIIWKTVFII